MNGGERGFEPRYSFPYTRFPGVLLQPLGHLTESTKRWRKYSNFTRLFQVFSSQNKINHFYPLIAQHLSNLAI